MSDSSAPAFDVIVDGDRISAVEVLDPALMNHSYRVSQLDNLLEIAQCLWESAVECTSGPLYAYLSQEGGTDELRSFLRERKILLACEEGWEIAKREAGFEDSFGWEFCPWFLRECLELNDAPVALRSDWRERCAAMAC